MNVHCYDDDSVQFQNATGGYYNIIVVAVDALGNNDNTQSTFNYYNAQPSYTFDNSKFSVTTARWGQNQQNYSIPIPFFAGETPEASTGEATPMYIDKPFFEGPSVQESLAYNLTMQLNASNLAAATEVIQFFVYVPGIVPALLQNFTAFTPEGNFTVTMLAPAMSGGFQGQDPENPSFLDQFTVWYNNTQYTSNIDISATQPINGTYPASQIPPNGTITINVNATNGSLVNISLMFISRAPVNITEQTITGFDMSGPPPLGGNLTTTMYLNVSGLSSFYSPDNISLDFMFPLNATEFYPDGTNQTFNISSNMTLRVYNESSASWELGNESGWTNYWTNITGCFNVSKNMTDAPDNGANITVCMTGYRFYISNQSRRTLDWIYGSSFAVNVSAFLSFPVMNESAVPSGGAGTNEYRCTVNMGTEAGLQIPDAKLPGIGGSGVSRTVYVDGRQLTSDQYSVGSLTISGVSLSTGAHDVYIVYTVPSTTTSTGTSIGTGAPTGETAVPTSDSAVVPSITAGDTQTVNFPGDTGITSMDLSVTNDVNGVKITITGSATLPEGIQKAPPIGTVYTYLDITTQNIQNNDIKNILISFKVNKQWLINNGFMTQEGTWLEAVETNVKLQMYSNNQWQELPTTQTNSDDDYVYFEASASEFGDAFAVTVEKLTAEDCRTLGCNEGYECQLVDSTYQCVEPGTVCDKTCPEGQTLNEETCECQGVYSAGFDYIWVMIAIATIIVFVFLFTYRPEIKEKFSMNTIRSK
jgi:PGF-pre-PGF domain-containing protein